MEFVFPLTRQFKKSVWRTSFKFGLVQTYFVFFKSRILIDIGVEISPLSARKVDFDI